MNQLTNQQISTGLENYPLIMKVYCTQEEITIILDDGRKMSIPTA